MPTTYAVTPVIPKDGTLTIKDATGSPITYTVAYEEGDFQVTGIKKGQYDTQVFKDRGVPYAVRQTEMTEAIEFSFSCYLTYLKGDATDGTSIVDVLTKASGTAWASATSTLPTANGDAYCLTVTWTGERTDHGATADTTLVLKYCNMQLDVAEGIPGKFSVTGRAFCISTDYISFT